MAVRRVSRARGLSIPARRSSGRVAPSIVRLCEMLVVTATILAVAVILEPWRYWTGLVDSVIASPGASAVLAEPAASPAPRQISGTAAVIDGDTLDLGGERIRLYGIDAFEAGQRCGAQACGRIAESALIAFVGDRPMACEVKDNDRYGRQVSVCRIAGTDVGAWMVERGHALAYRRYSLDYTDEEAAARQRRAGVWASRFDNPEDWRRLN